MRCLGRLFSLFLLAFIAVAAYCYFTPFEQYTRARVLLKLRQPEAAIAAYEKGIKRFPNSSMTPEARYEVGMVYFGERKYERAAVHLRKALEANPANARASEGQYSLGMCLVNLGKTERGIVELEKVRENYRVARDVVAKAELQLGRLYLDEEEYGSAARHAQLVLNECGKTQYAPAAQLLLGDIALARGNSRKAIAAYEKVSKKYPKHKEAVEAQLKIAKIYRDQRDLGNAMQAYKGVLRTSKDFGKQVLEDERVKSLLNEAKRFGESLLEPEKQ